MRIFSFIVLYAVLFAGLLIGAEKIARLKDYKPFRYQQVDQNEPSMFKPDQTIGWIPKPGEYLVPPYTSDGTPMQYTFLQDGSRATSGNSTQTNYDLLLIGCSFTEGVAVSDPETFAWKLQTEFPFLKVGNFGVGGYGTYQSLLLLRRLFEQGEKPHVVIYGFLPFHEARNIAPAWWLRFLAEFSKRGHVAVPYCSLNQKGQLAEHLPMQWRRAPVDQMFALPTLLMAIYFKLTTGEADRKRDQKEITETLLLEMRNLTKKNGAKFIVAILGDSDEEPKYYTEFFRNEKFEMINTAFDMTDDYKVQGEVHPNGKAHSLWADNISKYLKEHHPFFLRRIKLKE